MTLINTRAAKKVLKSIGMILFRKIWPLTQYWHPKTADAGRTPCNHVSSWAQQTHSAAGPVGCQKSTCQLHPLWTMANIKVSLNRVHCHLRSHPNGWAWQTSRVQPVKTPASLESGKQHLFKDRKMKVHYMSLVIWKQKFNLPPPGDALPVQIWKSQKWTNFCK